MTFPWQLAAAPSIAALCLATLPSLPAAAAPLQLAHADPQLEQALGSDPRASVTAYQRTLLLAQLANQYRQIGQATTGDGLFARAERNAAHIAPGYLRDHAAGHLANEYASTGDFERAGRTLDGIADPGARAHATWKVAVKLARAGHKEAAGRLLTGIEARVRPLGDLPKKAELLTGTGAAYKALDPAQGAALVFEAYGIAQTLPDAAARATMLNELGANFVDIGRRDVALRVFAEADTVAAGIADPLQRAQAYAMHGGELAEKGERPRAVPALEKAVAAALLAPDDRERAEVLSEIARNFGQSHAFARGLEIAARIADPYHRAEAWIRIAKNQQRTGEAAAARALLERTGELAATVADAFERATVLRKLASEWIVLKETARAAALLDAALQTLPAGSHLTGERARG